MYQLPLTLETPAENLALDEALLEAAEAGELAGETLRLWEPAAPLVVLGRSSPLDEVNRDDCLRDGVPVLRRCSGGATVVAGPGCLMYALVLDTRRRSEFRGVDRAHACVLRTLAAALNNLATGVKCDGVSDLTVAGAGEAPRRKFAGNSLRIRRDHLLYHGAILYDFPLERIGRWLAMPARQPCYREQRSHADFLTNLPANRDAIEATIAAAWQAREPLADWPRERTQQLAALRYASLDWNAPRSAPATC